MKWWKVVVRFRLYQPEVSAKESLQLAEEEGSRLLARWPHRSGQATQDESFVRAVVCRCLLRHRFQGLWALCHGVLSRHALADQVEDVVQNEIARVLEATRPGGDEEVLQLLEHYRRCCDRRFVQRVKWRVSDAARREAKSAPLGKDAESLADEQDGPIEKMVRDECNTRYRDRVDRMPDELRETWQLHFESDLTYEQIAALQGITKDGVNYRLRRARAWLQRAFSDEDMGPG